MNTNKYKNSKINRREMIKKTAKIGGIIVSAPFINIGQYQLFASTTRKYSKQTVDLVSE